MSTDEKKKWECFNAFKQGSKVYRFGDKITDVEYEKISDRNKKWFVEKDICGRCGDEFINILGTACCSKHDKK